MGDAHAVSEMRIAGRFRVHTLIAGGSMGEVWLGEDEHLGSRVAVKFLREAFVDDPWAVQRFFTEARIAAKLETRHVVRVLDYGTTEDGRPFVVMEFLDGETLAARLHRQHLLQPAVALRFLAPIARTLARAHALGVVHRDLKPENIFLALEEDGGSTPKLIDFGVAKILPSHAFTSSSSFRAGVPASLTDSGSPPAMLTSATRDAQASRPLHETDDRVLGTPPYMAPEQCASIPDATPASDQWSFGIVAYECLTGFLPFPRLKRSDMYRVLQFGRFTPATRVNPMLPPAFDRWMRTVLAIDPANRFPSLVACVEALSQALGTTEDEVRAGSSGRRRRTGSRASKVALAAAGLMFGVTVVLAAARSSSPALPQPTASTEKSAPLACSPPPLALAPVCAPAPPKDDALSAPSVPPSTTSPAHAAHTSELAASYRADPY